MKRRDCRVGTPVRVLDCSGALSGLTGKIAPLSDVRVDGRGVATDVAGSYRPVGMDVPVRMADGSLALLPPSRLQAQS